MAACMISGCGAGASDGGEDTGQENVVQEEVAQDGSEAGQGAESGQAADGNLATEESADAVQASGTGLVLETAADGHIDFAVLQAENPDIFAWLYVPGTKIDMPILQSPVSDEYYKTHTADGKEGDYGALYTEMPNMMNMCDFNTIIHGNDLAEEAPFNSLHRFEEPDFFTAHEEFYIYLPDNVLTYEVVAAYYDEGSDILRRYDYTTYEGCANYLKQLFGSREMGKNVREGWDDLTPGHFLVTLDGSIREEEDKQYVVVGALIGDAAGKIDRVILD